MPPRYAYWTILVDEQPTAFRAGSQEDLMPTFNRLKQKHADARMMWWQNGKLWNSRLDAQEAMRARGEMGRARDFRQRDNVADRKPFRRDGPRDSRGNRDARPEPRDERDASGKLAWKPKGTSETSRPPKQEWKPKGSFASERPSRPEWKSKPQGDRRPRSDWKPKSDGARSFDRKPRFEKPDWKPKGRPSGAPRAPRSEGANLEWKPKGTFSPAAEGRVRRSARPEGAPSSPPHRPAASPAKRKWVPKEEYKKSQGIEARRDKNWRPGGEHKDPRQKYKDAKKAKWGRFKQTIRKRWDAKQPDAPKKKRRDDE